jgi:uncharacterized membrane protein YcaP (DUF421 family)
VWQNLTHLDLPAFNLVARAAVVYFSILILLRVSGKRQLGQMGAAEFAVILLISNAVQNSMNGGDNSLLGGIILATVLVAISTGISFLTYRSRLMSALFEGTPTLLVHKVKIIRQHLIKERLTEKELKVLLRKQGFHHFNEIDTAILEADGTLSISKTDEPPAVLS